jgi:hypothetical protein
MTMDEIVRIRRTIKKARRRKHGFYDVNQHDRALYQRCDHKWPDGTTAQPESNMWCCFICDADRYI